MRFYSRTLAISLLCSLPMSATSATVDLLGKTYETITYDYQKVGFTVVSQAPNISLSAQLGGSVTTSYAQFLGDDFDTVLQQAISTGLTAFSLSSTYGGSYMQTANPGVTAYAFSNASALKVGSQNYFVFDLTFAPTAATVASDITYDPNISGFGPTTISPTGASQAGIWYHTIWDLYNLHPITGIVTAVDNSSDDYFLSVAGTVLPADPITPVPLPGSAALLALGLLGLSAAKRRKT